MASTVVVNFMTVVHAKSSGMLMCFPDVCKTPAPPAPPVPIPYPNVAQSSDTDKGTKKVTADGQPVMTKASNFKMSTGDEAGSVGGIISSKTKGKAYPQLYSMDVKMEGNNVVRLTDIMMSNGASPGNTPPLPEVQPPAVVMPGTNEDPKKPKITKLEFSVTEACCGDEVEISAETEDFPSGQRVALDQQMDYGDKPKSSSRRKLFGLPDDSVVDRYAVVAERCPEISGNKGKVKWQIRRGGYRKTVKIKLVAVGLGAPKNGDNVLEVKTAAPAKQKVGPAQRVTPQYAERLIAGTKVFAPNGANYGWEYCYEIEIADGMVIVSRKLDFDLKNGAKATGKNKRAWKRQIESTWDRRFKIHRKDCKRGDTCRCSPIAGCCQWQVRVLCDWGSGHGKKVELYPGANSSKCFICKGKGTVNNATCTTCNGSGSAWGTPYWWYSHTWWEKHQGVAATVRAHEFGHLIGMYDEYPEGACDPARLYTSTDSVMGAGTAVYERFYEEFRQWFHGKAGSVVGDTKLLKI